MAKRRPHRGYARFRKVLDDRRVEDAAKQRPPRDDDWTERTYNAVIQEHDGRCHWCGAVLHELSGGYWIDKIDPKRGYARSNCVACCWPCNRTKNNMMPEAFLDWIGRKVEQYGRGRVPWQTLIPGIKVEGPDVSAFRLHIQQRLL